MIGTNNNDFSNISSSQRGASFPQRLPNRSVHQLSGIISPLETTSCTTNDIEKNNLLRQILPAAYAALSNSVTTQNSPALFLQQHQSTHGGIIATPAPAPVVINSASYLNNSNNIQGLSRAEALFASNEMASICNNNNLTKLTTNLATFRTPNRSLLDQAGSVRMLQQQQQQQKVEKSSPTMVWMPVESDILLGRGGLANQHPGNVVYRALLDQQRARYMDAPKYTKKQISRTIVVAILQRGGRFLERSAKNGGWYPVPFEKAVNKTSQGLRGKISRKLLNEAQESHKSSGGSFDDEQCTATSTKE